MWASKCGFGVLTQGARGPVDTPACYLGDLAQVCLKKQGEGGRWRARACSQPLALPVGEVRLFPAPARQHEPLLSVVGARPVQRVRHAAAGRSGAGGRLRGLLGGWGRCRAAGRSFTPGLWTPSHWVAAVGILCGREDAGTCSSLGSWWPMVRGVDGQCTLT